MIDSLENVERHVNVTEIELQKLTKKSVKDVCNPEYWRGEEGGDGRDGWD